MEILKSFSFDLQRFGTEGTDQVTLKTVLTDVGAGITTGNQDLYWDGAANYTLTSGVGTVLIGTIKKAAAEDDNYTLTVSNGTLGADIVLTANDKNWNVTTSNAVTVDSNTSTGAATFSVANTTPTLTSGTFSALKNGALISTESTVSSTVAACKFTITGATGTPAVATYAGAGDIQAVKNATIAVDAASTGTTKITSDTNASVITVAASSAAGLSVDDGGVITLASGTYTNANFAAGTSPVKVSGTITYDDAVFTTATGTITGAAAVNVTAGTVALANTSNLTSVTAHNFVYTTAATSTVATFNGTTGEITSFTAGTVQTAAGGSIFVNGNTYSAPATKTATFTGNATKPYLSAGEVQLNSSTNSVFAGDNSTQVEYKANTGSVITVGAASKAGVYVTDLDKGEVVKIGDATYTGVSSTLVKREYGGTTEYYTVDDTAKLYELKVTDANDVNQTAATGTIIDVSSVTKGTKYYNVLGYELDDKTGAAVEVKKNSSNWTVNVYEKVGKKASDPIINLSGAASVVTDSSTGSDYTLASGIDIQGTSFSTNANGELIAAKNTITVTKGDLVISNSNAGSAKIDIQGATTNVTYKAGANLKDATIVYGAGANDKVTITETNKSGDTVIAKTTGDVSGLDDGAVVTGVVAQNVSTAANGTITVNGTAWTVAGSDDGVTLDYTGGKVSDITLGTGESITTKTKLTGEAFKVNTSANNYTFTKVQNGATFTNDSTVGETVTLYTAGDEITYTGSYTYKVDSLGSATDGVTVSEVAANGYLSALNDGDKVTVTSTGGTNVVTYEVVGKNLIATGKTGLTDTYVYTLSDSTETAFTVKDLTKIAALTTADINAEAATAVNATFATTSGTETIHNVADGLYVNADGTLTGSKDKAVGKLSVSDTLVKYDSQSDKAQEINVTNAGDKDWYITTGAGKDDIRFSDNTNVSINGGAGDDTIVAGGNGDKILYTGDGNNKVTLSAGASGSNKISLGSGNDNVTIGAGITGDVAITATGGKNLIDAHSAGVDEITIVGGSGNDTIIAANANNVVKGNGGNNTFLVTDGTINTKVKVADYTFGKDVLEVSAAALGALTKADFTADGKVTISGTAEADISATAGSFYAATLVDTTGKNDLNVAWAKDGAAKLDASSFTKNAWLIGNDSGENYIVSGSGKDTITSDGANDTVYGGKGDDIIRLSTSSDAYGRVVGFSTSGGKDNVSGYKATFEEGDSIYMIDGSVASLKGGITSSAGTATLKSGSAVLTFTSGITTQSSGAAEFVINGKKAAVIDAGATATVGSASYADAYIGDNSAIDFSTTDGDLYVDLSNSLASSGSGAKFVGIYTVTGGAGKSTLIGSAKDDSIVAGAGGSSLFGGAGKNTLDGSKSTDVSDSFFIGGGSGTSSIVGFTTADNDNADTFAVLSGNVTAAKLTSAGIEISSDGSKGIITGSVNADSMIKIDANNFKGVAKIGSSNSSNSFTFNKAVGFYGGGTAEDKLAVDSSNTDNAEVWLDGSKGTAYASVDVVDFSSGSADYILAGDSSKNTVVGGSGNNSLWGGAGNSVDVLESNSNGTTTFFYGKGEGNDVIAANSSNDVMNLYNISLSDVKTGEITGTGVNVEFNDGTKLTVNTGSNNIKFNLASGESYIANQSTKNWDQA